MGNELTHVANIVRGLAADGVQAAKSGHPGLPLGCAEIGSLLFFETMKHNPANPNWINRDRFVLSAGHGSMLLYSLLHLTGYDMPLEELKRFRQLDSKTPGHPEYGHSPGIETTTGPLGQGIGNAVGMALAANMLAARFNRPGYSLIDHHVYALCGDGDMMEGVSSEASSLAGHLALGNLVAIYDDNQITIEGSTELAFSESVRDRYAAYGWHVQEVDGHNIVELREAIDAAKAETKRPSLICAKTTIAKGSPAKAGTADAHGAPLGDDEVAALKQAIGLPSTDFYVSDEAYALGRGTAEKGGALEQEWLDLFDRWSKAYPDLAQEWERYFAPTPVTADCLPRFEQGEELATRAASGQVIQALASAVPNLVGGSADLSPSTNTLMKEEASVQAGEFSGRNLHFGVREHAMGALLNGMSLYGGFRVYGGTFLVFSDYMRPTVRLAALMNQPVIFVFTHDSIFVGEDGPTHQPVEQTEALRLIPNVHVYRPADAAETALAWQAALARTDGPTALILTRQALPVMAKADEPDFSKGGYILRKESAPLTLTLAATGSEVSQAVQAAELLEREGIGTRVVSVPCRELFLAQDEAYRHTVIPPDVPLQVIEVGVRSGWYGLAPGQRIQVYGLDQFGRSGPAAELASFFGFTPEAIAAEAKKLL